MFSKIITYIFSILIIIFISMFFYNIIFSFDYFLNELIDSIIFLFVAFFIFVFIFILNNKYSIFFNIDKFLNPKKYELIEKEIIISEKRNKKNRLIMSKMTIYGEQLDRYANRFMFIYNFKPNVDSRVFLFVDFNKYSILCKLETGEMKELIGVDRQKLIYKYKFKEDKYFSKTKFKILKIRLK